MKVGFGHDLQGVPAPAHAERAQNTLQDLQNSIRELADSRARDAVSTVIETPATRQLLLAVFGNSPFLTRQVQRDPAFAARLLLSGPDAARDDVLATVAVATEAAIDGRDPSKTLRAAKRQLALTVALADIADVWCLDAVTGSLSDFAEAAVGCAVSFLLSEVARRGVITLPQPHTPQTGSGYIVIGMGKLGARELNYSSDIDLIVLYDTERVRTDAPDRLQTAFVRLTRQLVGIIDARTADGYVFRTDLRLRPDPSSTPVAVSVLAAETYYETLGQNWERAAMIKARPVAGDIEAGTQFLSNLRPYVWRRNLDFAAIRDVHSIKRQINAHYGGKAIAVAGHNIKLGRGGIREIEFFAQTQQLIWGGKVFELRATRTVDALRALSEHGQISPEVSAELVEAYRFLRRVEHRLQMIDDEQTHTLPEHPAGLAALAVFLGYPDRRTFETELVDRLRTVETHYAHLFEDAPALSLPNLPGGNLVFTGADPDPETFKTLTALGFHAPQTVDTAVRAWHHGRYRATRSARTREILTELMPYLLEQLASSPDPDTMFQAFDRFLAGLPAGVQLFSMFQAHPQVLGLLVEIMGGAPRLARHLASRPSDLESVLTADFFDPPPPLDALCRELDRTLSKGFDLQDVLDLSRRWANERKFQVGVQMLRGVLDTPAGGRAYSNVADAVLRVLAPRIVEDFADRHGRIPDTDMGADMAIIALGKLGGREMTATSDLDLIFVYGGAPDGAVSDGATPLPSSQYFARLSQRLINALTAPTSEGTLYDVDMRLRPSGKAGPIAVSFDSFAQYQRGAAWTWERMAMTRSRVVAGSPHLASAIEGVIREVLTAPRDADTLLLDVAEMRSRMAAEHQTASLWEVKHMRGGLVDIEFIVQYLQLRNAAACPSVLSPTTADALAAIRDAGVIDPATAEELLDALGLWQAVQSRIRLAWEGPITAEGAADAPPTLRWALGGLLGLPFDDLAARMRKTAARTRAHFAALVEQPAADLRQTQARRAPVG